MPDILPVCMQDILYSRQSELRKGKISRRTIGFISSDVKSLLIIRYTAFCFRRDACKGCFRGCSHLQEAGAVIL